MEGPLDRTTIGDSSYEFNSQQGQAGQLTKFPT